MTCRELAEYMRLMDPNGASVKDLFRPYLDEHKPPGSYLDVQFGFLNSFKSAIEEVLASNVPPDSKDRYVDKLRAMSNEALKAFNAISAGKFAGNFNLAVNSEYLLVLTDAVEMGREPDRVGLGREEIAEQIAELIGSIMGSKLSEIAKRSMVIQLSAIQRIATESAIFSDSELRLRVKAVMADMMASWASIQQEDAELAQSMQVWMIRMAGKVRAGLGIAADIAQILSLAAPR